MELKWGPALLGTCCCFLLCSGVICPVCSVTYCQHRSGGRLCPWEPTNTGLLLCQHIRGDLVPLLSVFGLWLSCQLSWTHSGRCLAQQISHVLMAFEEPCFWCTRTCIITSASQSLAAGRAEESQSSTLGVSCPGYPVPPSLRNRAVLSSPSSRLVSADLKEAEEHPRVLVFSCTQTWTGIDWTGNSCDLHWYLSELSVFVFLYPLQFWYVVCVYKF